MIDKHGYIICDQTKYILEDKVSLLPKYIEVRDGKMIEINSTATTNEYRPGVPKHAKYETEVGSIDEKLNGKHFINMQALLAYIDKQA